MDAGPLQVSPARARPRRWLLAVAVLVVLGLLLFAGLWRLAASPGVLGWAVEKGRVAAEAAGVDLQVEGVAGSLLGTVHADRIAASGDGWAVEARHVDIDLDLLRAALQVLRTRSVAFDRLSIGNLRIATESSGEPARLPATLALPLAIILPQVQVGHLELIPAGRASLQITDLRLSYSGDALRHRVESLALRWTPPGGTAGLALAAEGSVGAAAPFPLALALRAGWGMEAPAARAREGLSAGPQRRPARSQPPGPLAADHLTAAARVEVEGTLAEPRVRAQVSAASGEGRARAHLEAAIRPFAESGDWLGPARVRVDEFDPARWFPGAPGARLSLEADVAASADRISGQVRVVNARPAPLDAGGLPLLGVDSRFGLDPAAMSVRLDGLRIRVVGGGVLTGRLVAGLERRSRPRLEGRIDASGLDLGAVDRRLPATRLSGALALAADATAQQADLSLVQDGWRIEARAEHSAARVHLPRLRLQAPGSGEVQGRAEFALEGERPFTAELTLRAFDLSALQTLRAPPAAAQAARMAVPVPDPTPARAAAAGGARRATAPDGSPGAVAGGGPAASLNGRLSVRGRLHPEWQVEVDAGLDDSEVRLAMSLPLRGRMRGRLTAQRIEGLDLRLESGRNRLRATGAYGRAGDGLDLMIELADPAPILPGSRGRLGVKARVEGTPAHPSAVFRANGESLSARGVSARAIEATGALAAAPQGEGSPSAGLLARLGKVRIDTQVRGLTLPGQGAFDVDARLAGDPARHQFDLEARAPGADMRAVLVGGVDVAGSRWQGELRQLEGRSRVPVRLQSPVQVLAGPGEFRLGPGRLAVAGGRVVVDALEWRDGRLATRGSLSALPLGSIHDLLAGRSVTPSGPPPIVSTLEVGGEWAFTSHPDLTGTLTLRRERGDLSLVGAQPFPLGLSRGDVDLRLDAGRLRGRARIVSAAAGEATITLGLDPAPRLDADADLSLRVDASVRSLRPVARLLPAVAEIDGAFTLRIDGSGTLRNPVLSGALSGQRLRVDAPQVGVALREGRLEATLGGGVLTVTTLEARAGEGRFTAAGAIPLRPGGAASSLRWQADRLALLSRPDRRVVLDGQGILGFERGQYRLAGQLRAREGLIELGRGSRTALGDDVVVRGRPAPGPATGPAKGTGGRALSLALEFDFGEAFRLVGSGLDTLVRGRIAFATSATGSLETRGTVSTERGTFSAFGQRLEIDRGTIVFNGPIDNPGLDIVALRRLPSVQAGVEVTGTANAPRVRITSNPALPQGEQLSWLVLGRALDSASQADAALLAGAAAAMLGGNGGVPVNRRIADAFGLDDVGVRSSGVLAGQVVTVGKRVSDRVYFAYEQAVSTASNLLRIDFELHRFVSLRAEAGSVSGFGIVFTRNLR